MGNRTLNSTLTAIIASLSWGAADAKTTVIDAHAIYPEGPVWRDDKLFFVEYGGPGVKVWDGKTIRKYWDDEHCGPSGLTQFKENHLLVACYDANTLVELDETGRAVRTIDKDVGGKSFVGPTTSRQTEPVACIFRHRASTT